MRQQTILQSLAQISNAIYSDETDKLISNSNNSGKIPTSHI